MKKEITRRDFIQRAGIVGLGALIGTSESRAGIQDPVVSQNDEKSLTVGQRVFGKSGVSVSILGLGGMFDIPNNQLLLRQAVRWGVTYWDTANSYSGGASERGIGKYFSRFPEDRKKIFLVSKSDARDLKGMTNLLHQSLDRMKTDYIDLYFIHGIRTIRELDEEIRQWVQQMKNEGKIRLFGFSTHSNMERCMQDAVGLGWIDGIMMTYNYRLMHTDEMKRAVSECQAAGIGLTAMKTQGGGPVKTDSETELMLAGKYLGKGLTPHQAKLAAVWQNTAIACICSQMPNLAVLKANVEAAVGKVRFSERDVDILRQYAEKTLSDYCAGCSDLCEAVFKNRVPVGDVMRCLMYSRQYGDHHRGAVLYHQLHPEKFRYISYRDISKAEHICPNGLPIGELIEQARRNFEPA